jgi:mycothiol synthase
MKRADLEGLPSLALPAPYRIRTYADGDEAHWAAIMNTGIGTDWTAERCRERLTGRPQFEPDGLYFATSGNSPREEVAGSACAWRTNVEERETGYVHMVCVTPEHRGHGLGYWLTLATLHYFRAHGYTRAILNTDDFRLPAIQTYLRLGFVPDMTHVSHPDRWTDALTRLLLNKPGGS